MVERSSCSNEPNASLNGVRNTECEGASCADAKKECNGVRESNAVEQRGNTFRRSNVAFSLLKWLKRTATKRRSAKIALEERAARRSASSSAESIDTFYSTTTVRSFAFHTGALLHTKEASARIDVSQRQAAEVGPFAAGASKVAAEKRQQTDVARTLPTNVHSRNKDITARYSLQATSSFVSCVSLPVADCPTRSDAPKESSTRRRVHVKGKRRAPNPPPVAPQDRQTSGRGCHAKRLKRRAPEPPLVEEQAAKSRADAPMEEGRLGQAADVIGNDTLVLRGGLLHSTKERKVTNGKDKRENARIARFSKDSACTFCTSSSSSSSASSASSTSSSSFACTTPSSASSSLCGETAQAMPRPWYKRSALEHSRDSAPSRRIVATSSSSVDSKEECSGGTPSTADASLSKLPAFQSFFHRADRSTDGDRKRETKRRSGISILANISELDKEAAAIVQEEQARARASMLLKSSQFAETLQKRSESNEEIVQDIVASAMESSPCPKRGTRALISKFNAISNITKVTVNANFFARNAAREQQDIIRATKFERCDWRENWKCEGSARQSAPPDKDISKYFVPQQRSAETCSDDRSIRETSSRISFLQKQLVANRMNESLALETRQVARPVARQTTKSQDEALEERKEEKEAFARLRKFHESKSNVIVRGFDERLSGTAKQAKGIVATNAHANVDFDRKRGAEGTKEGREPTKEGAKGVADQETATKVSKVLDVLVETEKDDRAKRAGAAQAKEERRFSKSCDKGKSPLLNRTDDPITSDLKEMLKEMKHSLPKRPKTKRSSNAQETGKELPPPNTAIAPMSYVAKSFLKKESTSLQSDYEVEKQKVSSSVQTSGSVRKLSEPSTTPGDGGVVTAGEATRKMASEGPKENTYANVMERQRLQQKPLLPVEEGTSADEEDDVSMGKDLNTLAINRRLRKLEAAIASGHHQQAAGLAKELARLKIHCSVIRQRSARLKDRRINVNMYIEDKLAHQGPIPLQLSSGMTVAELKAKIQAEFEIPRIVQRWIVGKNLADRDEGTLDELHAVDGSSIFLYLVAPELQKDRIVETDEAIALQEAEAVGKDSDDRRNVMTEKKGQQVETRRQLETKEKEETPEEVKMERYEELVSLENCDVIPNCEAIECPICFVTYGPREGVILRDCLHMFCRSCIANTIRYCEEAEVKCPYRDAEYTCESTLQEREIKALVEAEVYQQHLAKSIAQAENNAGKNAFHCKTPDCPGWCYYDDDVNSFLCPVCGMNNCLTCQVIHGGQNCKQYQQELRLSKETDQESRRTAEMLEEMVDRGEALACPTCAVVLMKKWGCDWLRCSMCKTEICWVTRGPRWGPAGKGDTSGGCRCGENGVKCHPRCNYCH